MKYLALIIPIFLVSCASAPKKAETEAETAKKAVEQAVEKKAEETAKSAEEMAKPAVEAQEGKIVCTYGKDQVRSLAVNKTEAGGCELAYEKNGESNTVATARQGTDHCNTVAERIKNNLTGSGFTCK